MHGHSFPGLVIASLLAIGVAAAPSSGRACDDGHGHGEHPRTPVEWTVDDQAPACMTLVDRSIDPVVHLQYEVPFDDVCYTPTVTNDRTHDFVAFCRDHAPLDFLPRWMTTADAVEAEPIYGPIEPDDVLETNAAWADCWWRLDDVGRRPITAEQASQGVDWDTSDLAPGSYVIAGYTYEPAFNLWWPHDGAFKVHDGDPAAVGPAVALVQTKIIRYRDELGELEGCVDAIDGAELVLSWAVADYDAQWEELSTIDVPGAAFSASFPMLEVWWGQAINLRVEVVDPMGRSSVAYLKPSMFVINDDASTDAMDTTGAMDATGAGEGSTGDGDDDGAEDEPSSDSAVPLLEPSGCACAGRRSEQSVGWWVLLAVFGVRRGRRARMAGRAEDRC
jgi:hypothetical protein